MIRPGDAVLVHTFLGRAFGAVQAVDAERGVAYVVLLRDGVPGPHGVMDLEDAAEAAADLEAFLAGACGPFSPPGAS